MIFIECLSKNWRKFWKNSILKIKKENYKNYFIYAYNKDYYKNKIRKSSTKLRKLKKYKSAFIIRTALNKAYRSINPTDEKPLVMDWNKMLDKINYGLYPNLILILTSNVHLEEINKKDGSLLRENRIHGAFHMTRKMLNESIKSKSEWIKKNKL